jgi:3-oxoacyl-[acyl-carrier protein] reductase
MSAKLKDKVCIITGAGHGFGEAMARRFAEEGARVVIADLNPTTGSKVEQEINAARGGDKKTALFQEANVTSRSSWENLLAATLKEFGKVDVVVNNAGTTYPKKASHMVTEEEYDKVITVNMKSIFLSVAVVVPYFMEQKAGTILNVSSVGGIRVKNGLVSSPHFRCRRGPSSSNRDLSAGVVWRNQSICEQGKVSHEAI